MASAPEKQIGQAGGLLNVTRSLGTSIGVAASAAVFSWRLRTNGSLSTLDASPKQLVASAHYVLAMFAVFALFAFALSWMRSHRQERHSKTEELANHVSGQSHRRSLTMNVGVLPRLRRSQQRKDIENR